MDAVDLTLIPKTKALYAVGSPSAAFVFALSDPPQQPPASIPLADTWADEGQPDALGWYVVVTAVPAGDDAARLEQDLVPALGGGRGFAWSTVPPATFALVGRVPIALDATDRPIAGADAPVRLPKGIPQLTFAADLRVAALGGAGGPTALGVTDPAGPPELGLTVTLVGPTSGCVSFSALLQSKVEGDRSIKPLAAAQIDPLRPFDPKRTKVTPLGPEYALIHVPPDGYRLEAARS